MDFAKVTRLALSASIMLIVFSLGLQATPRDATYLFQQPRRFFRSLFAMSVVMPVFAGVLVYALALPPPVEITLVVLSVSPVPPILPKRALAAGGSRPYALGLLVAAALTSILFVPAAVELFGRIFDRPARMPAISIALIVTTTVIGPLAAGLALRSICAGFAARSAAPLSRMASLLLIVSVLPLLLSQRAAALSLIGKGTLLAMTAFVTVGCVAGALLGGPALADRTVLVLSTASRHPGVAMAIASANFPDQKHVLPAVLLYLIVSALVSSLFLSWLRRKLESATTDHDSRQSPAA